MNLPLTIRTFQYPEDFAAVVDLWDNSSPGIRLGRSDTKEEILKKILRDPDLFLVAELGGEIVGAVLGGFDGRRGMVYHLAVRSANRQQGIGTALMDTLEDQMREEGCLRSYLLVRKDNEASGFFKVQGWQELDLHIFGKNL
jgi:ribosomal protein S18 acetylase RimI-like enzyme